MARVERQWRVTERPLCNFCELPPTGGRARTAKRAPWSARELRLSESEGDDTPRSDRKGAPQGTGTSGRRVWRRWFFSWKWVVASITYYPLRLQTSVTEWL